MKIYSRQKKILIIKFGGLGDIILSLNAIFSIIKYHKAQVVLLTEKPFENFFARSEWFKDIITIKRSFFYFMDIKQIRKKIIFEDFDFVYDLQTSRRTSFYLKYFYRKKIITNGIGKYAKIEHDNKNRNNMHTLERQKDQIGLSNIKYESILDLPWLFKSEFLVPKNKFALIVPGGSKKRVNKRIPIEIYKNIVIFLLKNNYDVLIVGGAEDQKICKRIKLNFPSVKDLCNKTSLFDLGKLSKYSSISIGNDTGPIHLISKGGNNTFVFFTKFSKPELCSPIGEKVSIFKFQNNNKKFIDEVLKKLKIKLSL